MRRREFLQKLATGLAAVVAFPVVAKQLIPQVDLIESKAWELIRDPLPLRFMLDGEEWKPVVPYTMWQDHCFVNPDYMKAPFEGLVYGNKKFRDQFRVVVKPRPIEELQPLITCKS